jgi:hypothetical protein
MINKISEMCLSDGVVGAHFIGIHPNITSWIIERKFGSGLALFWCEADVDCNPALYQSHASLGPRFLSIIQLVPLCTD